MGGIAMNKKESIDWEQRRYETSRSILAAMYSNKDAQRV